MRLHRLTVVDDSSILRRVMAAGPVTFATIARPSVAYVALPESSESL